MPRVRAAITRTPAGREAHLARVRAQNKQRADEIRGIVRLAKAKPCADCGGEFPYYVMDFDHRADKDFTIGRYTRRALSNVGRERLLAEIAKCDVVCANCHRIRTNTGGGITDEYAGS